MSKMIVVTGGAGFIGSALIRRMNELGSDRILIVDNLGRTEKWRNIEGLNFEDYIHKDLFLERLSAGLFEGTVSEIFHLGAQSSTAETDVEYLLRNNYGYTKTLATWAIKEGARFVYASSAATYGDGSSGFSDNHACLAILRPLNAYGYSKHLFDRWALKNGLLEKITGLKYFNVFGPNEWHKGEMRSMVLKAFEQVKANGKVRLFKSYCKDYADGGQLRDFIYVRDAVDITLFLGEHQECNGIFNVGTGLPRAWNDLARAVFSACSEEPVIEYVDMPECIRDKYQYFTRADLSKLRDAGYENESTPLEATVKDYLGRIS